jgi:hypothetical protein
MSTKNDITTGEVSPSHRGFIYFCEETLRYNKGARAWAFFGPYLLGAIYLEPGLNFNSTGTAPLWPWLLLLAYLVAFPPIWRSVLTRSGLWRKRGAAPEQAIASAPLRALCHRHL